MKTSSNYGLKLPEGTDNVKRQDFVDNFTAIDSAIKAIADNSYPIVNATGTNAYVGTNTAIKSLAKGTTKFTLFLANDATENCTLNLNNYGAKSIKDSNGTVVNNLKKNIPYNLCYNGTDFILQGKGGGGDALPEHVLINKKVTVDSGPIVGIMPNNTGTNKVLGLNETWNIPTGFHDGNGRVTQNIPNNGNIDGNLNCGQSKSIPTGYTNGGTIIANSLASQTPSNADASKIVSGYHVWVNGADVWGNASIQSLGGRRFSSGTAVAASGTYVTADIGFVPSVIVAICNYQSRKYLYCPAISQNGGTNNSAGTFTLSGTTFSLGSLAASNGSIVTWYAWE